MKNLYLIIAAVTAVSMLTLPFLSLKSPEKKVINTSAQILTEEEISTVRLKTESGISEIPMTEYILGVLAAEMPARFETEALKAQAVAGYTYTLYKKVQNASADYDITADATLDQAYITDAQRHEKWDENYEEYSKKLSDCIAEVNGIYISFSGEPIYAAYHAISGGKTEACADVFGGDYPYLIATESIGDLMVEGYLTKTEIAVNDFRTAINPLSALPENAADFIGEIKRSDSGGVKSIMIAGKEILGTDFRAALKLRSTNFDIELSGDKFIITTRGYGHCVGLSQYGANYMAKNGSTYEEILLWYYKDCVLLKNAK